MESVHDPPLDIKYWSYFFTEDEKHLKLPKIVSLRARRVVVKVFEDYFFYKLLNCKKAGRQKT